MHMDIKLFSRASFQQQQQPESYITNIHVEPGGGTHNIDSSSRALFPGKGLLRITVALSITRNYPANQIQDTVV